MKKNKTKNVSQLQQFAAIMIKAVFVKFEKCHIREEEEEEKKG